MYANLQADQDMRHGEHEGMRQEMTLMGTSFGTEVAFMEPEILRIGRDRLKQFVSTEPRLGSYRFYIDEILRGATHTLSEAEEKILASVASVTTSPSSTFGVFMNAEFSYPSVTLTDGRTVKVDQ